MLVPTALCPLLLDRERESAVLAAALGSLFSGSGAALTIVGETGLGKTRLAAELARAASERGAIVLRAAAVPDGVDGEPFGALCYLARSAIAAGASTTTGSAALFRRARVALDLDHAPPDPIPPALDLLPEPVAARALVLDMVEQLCRRRPVVVVLEDLHHATAETHAAAHLLCESVRSTPLLVVVTAAPEPDVPPLPSTRLDLEPLEARSVHRMIASCLHGIEIPEQLSESVLEHSAGVPLLVEDLLAAALNEYEQYPESGRVDLLDLRVPETFAASVAVRLNRRVRTRQVIEAAAVLGNTFEWRLLADTIDVAEIDVLNALHMAIGLQLLGPDDGPDSERFSFRSEATRTTVLAHIAESRRREIASSALAGLECRHPELSGTRLTQAAHLAILADQPERAAELWRHAGQRFAQLGAPAEALGSFDAASIASKAQAEEPLDLALARALACVGAGRIDRLAAARDTLRKAATAPGGPGAQAVAAHTALGHALVTAGFVAEAREELDLALDRESNVVTGGSEGTAAHVGEPDVALLAARIAAAEGRWDDVRSLAMQSESAAVSATAVAAVELRGRVEAVSDPREAQRLLGRAMTAARREEMGQFEIVVQREAASVDALMMLDAGPLEAVRSAAAEAGLGRLVAAVDGDLAAVHAARWDVERAAAAARRQRDLVRRLGLSADRAEQAEVLASQCSVLALNGDGTGLTAIERQLEQLDADCRLWVRCAESQATLAIVDADPAAALAAFDRAVELSRTCSTVASRPFAWQALLRAVCSESGMTSDSVRRPASDFASMGPWEQALLDCAAAIEAGLTGDADGAVRSFTRGLAGFEPLGEIGPRYVALWLVSERAAATGWGEPERWSREAARWFEARGHHRLAAACRSVLRSSGAKVPRRGRGESRVPSALAGMGLTSREVDVLALVAEGLTNKEVARRLFISPRTVGNHVASLLAKTGTRRRSELRELAARHGLTVR